MRLNPENIRITHLILQFWVGSIFRVVISHPSGYLIRITSVIVAEDPVTDGDRKIIQKVVKGVKKLSPLFSKKRRCLMEALVVYNTLIKFGITPQIRLGAKREKHQLVTHAWVDVNGRIIIGGPISGYEELIRTG